MKELIMKLFAGVDWQVAVNSLEITPTDTVNKLTGGLNDSAGLQIQGHVNGCRVYQRLQRSHH